MISCYLSEPGYWNHLGPVWAALPDELRGPVFGPPGVRERIDVDVRRGIPHGDGPPVLVASGGDARQIPPQRQLFHLQHGAAQSYNGDGHCNGAWGYAGGPDLDHVDAFLCVNADEAARWRAAYPSARTFVVGAPCLDAWCGWPFEQTVEPDLVAFSFHWSCTVSPEARPALVEWRATLAELAQRDRPYRILGHEHPRWHGRLLEWWRRGNADAATASWDEVMAKAAVYVCDNSSTMYEFMATGRPVIGLQSARWRIDVEHGLRFWEHAPPVDLPASTSAAQLDTRIRQALAPSRARLRVERDVVDDVYGRSLDGRSSWRAAQVIEEMIG